VGTGMHTSVRNNLDNLIKMEWQSEDCIGHGSPRVVHPADHLQRLDTLLAGAPRRHQRALQPGRDTPGHVGAGLQAFNASATTKLLTYYLRQTMVPLRGVARARAQQYDINIVVPRWCTKRRRNLTRSRARVQAVAGYRLGAICPGGVVL
jgi:hypothetical protein